MKISQSSRGATSHFVASMLTFVIAFFFLAGGLLFFQYQQLEEVKNEYRDQMAMLRKEVASISEQLDTVQSSKESIKVEGKKQNIEELKLDITYPEAYTILKNTEKNRRGSFLSYNFNSNLPYPSLFEIQFFNKQSIETFIKNCSSEMPCFEGDYPDIKRYEDQKAAWAAKLSLEKFPLQKIGGTQYFVSEYKASGDDITIREYTTFAGDTKIDIIVFMKDATQQKQADAILEKIALEFPLTY